MDEQLGRRIAAANEAGTRLILMVRWALDHGEMSSWEDHSPEEAANDLFMALKQLKG